MAVNGGPDFEAQKRTWIHDKKVFHTMRLCKKNIHI